MDRFARLQRRVSAASPFRVAIAGLAVLAAFSFLIGSGYDRSDIEFGDGSVWLPNEELGELAHVTGPSAQVDFRTKVAGPGDELALFESERAIYVLNRTDGRLERFDPRSGVVDAGFDRVSPGGEVAVAVGDDSVFLLDGAAGRLFELDAETLDVEARADLVAGRASGAVGEDDTLFYTEAGTAELVTFRGGEVVERRDLDAADAAELQVALFDGSDVGAFDLTAGTWLLPGESARDLPGDVTGTVRVGSGDDEHPGFTAAGTWTALDGGSNREESSGAIAEDDRLTPPVRNGDRVYVGDPTTGQLLVVEFESGDVLHRARLAGESGALVVEGSDDFGFAVLNGTNRGFVVDPDGEQTEVDLGSDDAVILDSRGEDISDVTENEERSTEEQAINREFTSQQPVEPVAPEDTAGPDDTGPTPVAERCDDGTETAGRCTPCLNGGSTAGDCEPCFDGSTSMPGQCPDEPLAPVDCPDGTQVPNGQECPPVECADGSQVPNGDQCPPVDCPDGSQVPNGQGCPPVECPDGSQVPNGQRCPPTDVCPDGSHVPVGQDCPPTTCPDGSQVPNGQGCAPVDCPDGSQVPNGQACPPVNCPDGSQVPNGQACPPVNCPDGSQVPNGQACPPVNCPDGSQVPNGQPCPTPPGVAEHEGSTEASGSVRHDSLAPQGPGLIGSIELKESAV